MKDRDRDIYSSSRRERRARERTRSRLQIVLVTVIVILIGVTAVSFFAIGGNQIKPAGGSGEGETAIPAVSAGQGEASSSAEPTVPPAATAAPTSRPASSAASSSRAESEASSQGEAASPESETSREESASSAPGGYVEEIGGESVYMDTKHEAPEATGRPLLLSAVGETSYGFDWDYETDNKIFQISCNYSFSDKTYHFAVYGAAPGTANITIIYNTSDDQTATLPVTIRVDENLNVTREG